ncbi:HAMP domain-containing sensor histidine kinase [Streptomyces sp. NPDC047046]|uniref:sensor histidine kinase n=1 Tax=Streptomyces sp. NPDC047046 TaxID=3155378 RepID=UPI0034097C87
MRARLPRPRSLRGRLLLALLASAALALLVLDAVVYGALRDYLTDRTDTTLRAVRQRVSQQLTEAPPGQALGNDVRLLGASEFFLRLRRPDGSVRELAPGLRTAGDAPRLPDPLPRPGTRDPVTVPAERDGGPEFRVLTQRVAGRGVLVAAVPLADVRETLRRLLVVEAVATGGVLVLLGGAGLGVLRRGLRPLEVMAEDADAITAGRAGGDVAPADEDTEVGRLGAALNAMLAGQRATQERLRRFVADASHELRTPVTAVLGYADLHHQGVLEEPAHRERAMRGITAEALRMQRLVDDLLLLARLDAAEVETPLRPAEVDLVELVEHAADAFRASHPNHPLTVVPGPQALKLRLDPQRVRQVLDNLLTNAAVHTPPGTGVSVGVWVRDGSARVRIADAGPGVPAADQERVFDRFYRVDKARSRDRGGSGLGLAVASSLVRAHGGTITLESEPGSTVFTVSLPLTLAEAPSDSSSMPRRQAGEASNR